MKKTIKLLFSLTLFICFVSVILLQSWTGIAFLANCEKKDNAQSYNNKSDGNLVIFKVTNNYTPYSGGIVSAINASTNELRKQGHRVIIITLDFLSGKQQSEEDVIRIFSPIKFTYCKNHMAIPWRPYKALYKLIEKYNPDIIHVYHPFLLGVCALKAGNKLNVPVVFTYYTLYEQYLHYVPLPKNITQPVTNMIVKLFCQQVDGLIVPSSSISTYIGDHGIKKDCEIIPGGILPIFEKNIFNYKPKTSSRFNLLTVSRFAKEKNIQFLLNVYKKLDKSLFKLTLVGYGPELENLKTYAYKNLDLSPNDVEFIIKPAKETLVSLYDKSDLFIYSSQTETQGFVLAEALARGTPIVALDGPAISDIVKPEMNGFIVNNEIQMVDKINLIKQDKNLHKNLQYQAWLTGQEYYSNACTSRLVSFYRNIIKQYYSWHC